MKRNSSLQGQDLLDYHQVAGQFKNMFRSAAPVRVPELEKLEKLVKKSESRIQAESVRNKPKVKADQEAEKLHKKKAAAAEKTKALIRTELLRQEEKRIAKANKERRRLEFESEDRRRIPTRVINHAELIPVKIDAKTTIYIKSGQDPAEAKKKFLNRHR